MRAENVLRQEDAAREASPSLSISPLSPSAVHIWKVSLLATPHELAELSALLSSEESTRADRFRFAWDRRRFIVAHGRLRQILAAYLDTPAQNLRFTYGSHGKPFLLHEASSMPLHFNLSHSEDQALMAVSQRCAVGIDLERIRPEFADPKIVGDYFSGWERDALCKLPTALWTAGFFKCWTSKEAYLKGMGDGMHIPLDAFDVSVDPGQPAALLRAFANQEDNSRWTLHDVEVGAGFVGALALAAPVSSIQIMTVFSDFHLFEHLYLIDDDEDDTVLAAQAGSYLQALGIAHKVNVERGRLSTTDLSAGQRKRLALVSAYLEDRPIYLFDEWAADQDPGFRRLFYTKLLPELKQRGKTVIAITHDNAWFSCADRIVEIVDGRLHASSSVSHPLATAAAE